MNFKKISTTLLLTIIVLGIKLPSTYGMDRGIDRDDIELAEFARQQYIQHIPLKEERNAEEKNVFVQNKLNSSQTNKQKSIQKEREELERKKKALDEQEARLAQQRNELDALAQKNQKTVEPAVEKKKTEDPKILAKAQKLCDDWAQNVLLISSRAYRDYFMRDGTEEEEFNEKYKKYTDCWWIVENHDLAKAANCDPHQQLIKLATTDDDLYVILLRAKEADFPGLKQKLQRAKVEYFVQQVKASLGL